MDKLKKFTLKATFVNIEKQKYKKVRNNITHGCYLSDLNPELSFFYAINDDAINTNPISYYKFNTRTISDAVVVSSIKFRDVFLKN